MKNPPKLQFMAVGPQRTGTSWLYEVLRSHPSLCFPKGVKETMFFEKYYSKGLDWYFSHFNHCLAHQICGEIGPTYFDMEQAPKYIYEINPAIKIIINLRHPLERTLSLYRHFLSIGLVSGSFSSAIEQMPRIITAGHYAQHVPRWLDLFGEKQVFFITLDAIDKKTISILEDLYSFLEIEACVPVETAQEKVNRASLPKYPWIAKLLTYLAIQFRSYRLHSVVEFGKKLGMRRVYSGGEEKLPMLTTDEQSQLLEIFEADIVYVEKLLDIDLKHWRSFLG